MKVWITKYALSKGLYQEEVETCFDISTGMVKGRSGYFHKEGGDWVRTAPSALCRANDMRSAKLRSIEKQIAKLKKLDFSKQIR